MTKTLSHLILTVALFSALLLASPGAAMLPPDAPSAAPAALDATQAETQAGSNAPYVCAYRQPHADLLARTTEQDWVKWVSRLSGEVPVNVRGTYRTINNRHSFALFNRDLSNYAISYGFDYLVERVQDWYPASQIEIDLFTPSGGFSAFTWKNLIVTIPGTKRPEEVVLLTAHFDSTNGGAGAFPPVNSVAPGAEDNASGSASLLEAARILQDMPLDRTVRLVWFTGEEQGLYGSGAYVSDHDLSGVVGVINLDMFGYDSDNDRCFELHVSNPGYNTYLGDAVPSSERIGSCFASAIDAYNLGLTYDFISGYSASGSSDHRSFWLQGIGAVEVLENYSTNYLPGGCSSFDRNPNYHQATDTLEKLNTGSAFAIHSAALATLFSMATLPELTLYMPLSGR